MFLEALKLKVAPGPSALPVLSKRNVLPLVTDMLKAPDAVEKALCG